MGRCPDTDLIRFFFLVLSVCLYPRCFSSLFFLFVCFLSVWVLVYFLFALPVSFFFLLYLFFHIFFSFNEKLAYHWEPKFEDCATFLLFSFSVCLLFVCLSSVC